MYIRFPELVPREVPSPPTKDAIDSGQWCPPGFEPDESRITILEPGRPVAQQFVDITPEYTWLESDHQTLVAVSSPHIPDPNHGFYADIRALFGLFAGATQGRPRAVLKEGRLRPPGTMVGMDDNSIIRKYGDMAYLQTLARHYGVECLSTEPVEDKEMLAVMTERSELRRAVVMYVKMRMLPQFHRQQGPVLDDYRQFIEERHETLGGSWTANHLYSTNYFEGPGSLNAIARHLARRHGLDVGPQRLNEGPGAAVREQIFRCANSPVYQPAESGDDSLCEVQQVAVLVNRLRDRRIAYLLHDLGQRATSYFFMSGVLHYEVNLPGLLAIGAERGLPVRNVSSELGLRAIQAASVLSYR